MPGVETVVWLALDAIADAELVSVVEILSCCPVELALVEVVAVVDFVVARVEDAINTSPAIVRDTVLVVDVFCMLFVVIVA